MEKPLVSRGSQSVKEVGVKERRKPENFHPNVLDKLLGIQDRKTSRLERLSPSKLFFPNFFPLPKNRIIYRQDQTEFVRDTGTPKILLLILLKEILSESCFLTFSLFFFSFPSFSFSFFLSVPFFKKDSFSLLFVKVFLPYVRGGDRGGIFFLLQSQKKNI